MRVFDWNKDWSEAFRDDQYGDDSYGASFSADGRLATTSFDGMIRLYRYDRKADYPELPPRRRARQGAERSARLCASLSVRTANGSRSVTTDFAAVDLLDASDPQRRSRGEYHANATSVIQTGLSKVAWSRDGQTLVRGRRRRGHLKRVRLLFAVGSGRISAPSSRTEPIARKTRPTDVSALPDGDTSSWRR